MAKGIQKAEYNDPTPNNFPDDYDRNDVDSRVLIRTNAVLNKEFGGQTRAAMAQAEEITSVVAGEAKSEASHATQTANDLQQRYQDQIEGQIEPSEVVDARRPVDANAYPTLNQRLQAGVDDRSKNVKAFGVKGDGTTDDLAAINTLIANANDGDTLFFPAGNYKVSGNIVINKKINLIGVKPTYSDGDLVRGTVIRGGGIFFVTGSSNSSVSSIGVVVATGFTNGFDIRGVLNGITIQNCLTIAQSHGYLIESYDGLVDNTKVINCESYDSIHGFISKATRTTFDNCQANNHSAWGFGVISDNIQGANKLGEAINNKISNCRAVNCGVGFSQYKRDYFSTDSNMECTDNQFDNISASSCVVSLSIGDKVGDTGNGKYTSFPVSNTLINGFSENSPTKTSRIYQSVNLVLNSIHFDKFVDLKNDYNNVGLKVGLNTGASIGDFFNLLKLERSSAPSLAYGRTFRTDNIDETTIVNFIGGVNGETYEIVLWDSNTTIKKNDNIFLINNDFYGSGNAIKFRYQDGIYFEISRTSASPSSLSVGYEVATNLIATNQEFFDIKGKGKMTNKISLDKADGRASYLIILIRSTNGTFNFTGFDVNQFVVPSDMPKSVDFGIGLITNWVYMPEISKYILMSKYLTKYI